ncbi:MAG: lactoylglutathione lyase [Arenicellales bacterium]
MRYLHTMVRVKDLNAALAFYQGALGMVQTRRSDYEKGRFTLVFLAAPGDMPEAEQIKSPVIELTHNWDTEEYDEGRNFGHLAFEVDDIYATCQKLMDKGVVINRPPRDGYMAFVRSPDNISIELLQKGNALAPTEPWASMENIGHW